MRSTRYQPRVDLDGFRSVLWPRRCGLPYQGPWLHRGPADLHPLASSQLSRRASQRFTKQPIYPVPCSADRHPRRSACVEGSLCGCHSHTKRATPKEPYRVLSTSWISKADAAHCPRGDRLANRAAESLPRRGDLLKRGSTREGEPPGPLEAPLVRVLIPRCCRAYWRALRRLPPRGPCSWLDLQQNAAPVPA